MEVTLTIPDDIANELLKGTSMTISQRLLEMAALKAYEAGLVTKYQVQEMLGYETRFDVDALFKAYNVTDRSFTLEELDRERATAAALFGK